MLYNKPSHWDTQTCEQLLMRTRFPGAICIVYIMKRPPRYEHPLMWTLLNWSRGFHISKLSLYRAKTSHCEPPCDVNTFDWEHSFLHPICIFYIMKRPPRCEPPLMWTLLHISGVHISKVSLYKDTLCRRRAGGDSRLNMPQIPPCSFPKVVRWSLSRFAIAILKSLQKEDRAQRDIVIIFILEY